jgi:hypothetical protein
MYLSFQRKWAARASVPAGSMQLPDLITTRRMNCIPDVSNPLNHMKPILSCLLPLTVALLPCLATAEVKTVPLAGTWRFQLDAQDVGMGENWQTRMLEDSVTLPGTTDTNQKGTKTDYQPADRLARVWSWIGPAWYQREVTIPESWNGKRITLWFERTKNSRVWVNETFAGGHDSLSAPHVFDLTAALKPGTHILTVRIDNAKLPPVGPSHAVDERTQTNWNGIVGKMELRATDPVWLEDVQVYPDVSNRTATVKAVIRNLTGKPATGSITISSESYNSGKPATLKTRVVDITAAETKNPVEFTYEPGPETPLWDEFDPAMIRLSLKLDTRAGDQSFSLSHSVRFGMRNFTREGNRLLLNGRPVFLRGRIDCANYPLTGYAPMAKDEWVRLMEIHKQWGINHVRYHSWCPPAAAFEAADEAGILLQPELPNKRSAFNAPDDADAAFHNIDFMEVQTTGSEVSLYEYAKREGGLIFRHFGNSPSFVLFTLGNELGRNEGMFEMVAHYQKIDPRRLYAQGSNNMHWDPSPAGGDDFWVIGKLNRVDKPLRGSFSFHDFPNPHIENRPPSTMVDYSFSIAGVPVPLIGHETGQFQSSPDFREIGKFTGVLEARNYQLFRDRLEAAGMIDQAHDFFKASGALAVVCYREDIEAALRTREFGGFQLLDLQDFPGQGTALVGLLNVFMENKGFIEPEHWREFCRETVPLSRMEKYVWTHDETLSAKVQIAHYGPADLENAVLTATLTDNHEKVLSRMEFPATRLPTGDVTDIGDFKAGLATANPTVPQQLTLTLAVEGTRIRNSYPVWVFPKEIDNTKPEGVWVTRSFTDAATREHLAKGGRVLLFPELGKLPHSVAGQFQTEFWSPMFAQSARRRNIQEPPGTLGLLCDPAHPALAEFPTSFHSEWQWWQLVRNSRPIIFDGSPRSFRPLVQMIDNFERNHKLGLIAETKVGKGSMLICSIDLPKLRDKPEARQLMHSLLAYVGSADFAPKHELEPGLLEKLLPE